jgi:hypothetical protein
MSLENYEPVAVRLDRLLTYLRNLQTEPRIITHMVSAPGADICVFRAELWLGDTLYATGWAEEIRGVGNVNKTSHLENCETSALGRMCEAYSPTANDWRKRPSREEMEKVFRADDSPPSTTGYKDHSNPPASTTVRGPMTGAASEKQIGYIMGACKRDGIVPPAWVKNLSKQDASSFIEAHKNGEAISAILERLGANEEPF